LIKVLKESRVRKALVELSQGTARVSHAHMGCAAAKGRRTQDQGVSQSCSDTMKDLGRSSDFGCIPKGREFIHIYNQSSIQEK
jgi:hypothetical protein